MLKKIAVTMLLMLVACAAYPALLVDDCETGTMLNSMSGPWYTYDDGVSSLTFTADSSPGYNSSSYAKQMDITCLLASSAYAGAITYMINETSPVDVSAYYGVRFYAKGSGGYTVAVPMTTTAAEYNHYNTAFNVGSSWELFEVPFDTLAQPWGTPRAWDPLSVTGVQFNAGWTQGTSGQLYVDNIEFYTEAEAVNTPNAHFISYKPKINQVGYLPSQKKYFTVITQTASTGAGFEVKSASGGSTVYSGTIAGSIVSDAAAGEDVVCGDFSAFTAPGHYYIEAGGQQSFTFEIADDIYDDVFTDSLRAFYIIRANDTLNDSVTGLSHPASHQLDAAYDDKPGSRDMKGGWYNAGDFGKWTHEAAFSAGYMMWLYELKENNMKGLNIQIPESGNGVSDLLNEARWGIEWLHKMQNPDGSVYHKVDTEPNFAWGTAPDLDPHTRTAKPQGLGSTQFSTIDASVFCAVNAQAYRIFGAIDPAFAAKCSTAAKAAWDWLDAGPKTGQADPYYTDSQYWQELMWAQAEMFTLTGDIAYSNAFEAQVDSRTFSYPNWTDTQFFAYMAVYFNTNTAQPLKDKIKTKVLAAANAWRSSSNAGGYRVALGPTEYWWGSVSTVMGRGNVFIFAYLMTDDESWLDYALYQLDYMSGVNALEQMFYTGHGTKKNENPYHWSKMVYNNPLPGWCTGGPNPLPTGADGPLIALQNEGTPAQKCWLDLCASNGSWASNEGTTDQNAHLVFLSGFFFSEVTGGQGTGVPADNLDNVWHYPSPINMLDGDTGVTFNNLKDYTKLQVFNLSGGLVYSINTETPEGTLTWNLANRPKDKIIAPGLYVYVITDRDNNEYSRGKIAIIR